MATTFKHVWQFIDVNAESWAEIYYRTGTVIAQENIPDTLVSARLGLLGPLAKLVRVRISAVDVARQSKLPSFNKPGTAKAVSTDRSLATSGVAVVYNLTGVNGGSRRWWIRGALDEDVGRNPDTGIDFIQAGFATNINAFLVEAAKFGYGVRTLVPPAFDGSDFRNIVAMAPVVGQAASLVTHDGNAYVGGLTRIIISLASAKDLPSLNGHWSVQGYSAATKTFTIRYALPNGTAPANLSARFRQENYNPVSVFNPPACGLNHVGTRDTRAPLSNSRGARRAKRTRQSV